MTTTGWFDKQKAVTGQTLILKDKSTSLFLREPVATATTESGHDIEFSISGLTLIATSGKSDAFSQVTFNIKEVLELLGDAVVELVEEKS